MDATLVFLSSVSWETILSFKAEQQLFICGTWFQFDYNLLWLLKSDSTYYPLANEVLT